MKKSALLWQALNYNLTSLPWYPAYEVAELLIEDMNPSFDNVGGTTISLKHYFKFFVLILIN